MAEDQNNTIYNISWVLPENFDPNKVSIIENLKVSNGLGGIRSKIMYHHPKGEKDLLLTVPLNKDAMLECRGVQKNVYTKNDMKVETNRYVAPLVLRGDNPHHIKLYEVFQKLQHIIQSKTGATTVTFPIKDTDNGYSIIYANLIHSANGYMFSTAYTSEELINIHECKKSLVRPALLFSTIRKSESEYKIQIQISQMYIAEEIKDFPLATRNM